MLFFDRTAIKVSEIWIHPVKSLAGISVDSCLIDDWGFEHDRQYMLCIPDPKVPGQYRYLTQRTVPALTLVKTAIDRISNTIRLEYKSNFINIPLRLTEKDVLELERHDTFIWDLTPESIDITPLCPGLPEFFDIIRGTTGLDTKIVAPGVRRRVFASTPDNAIVRKAPMSSFQDYFPGNMLTQSSLDDLQVRVRRRAEEREEKAVSIGARNFRPNLVLTGTTAWDEDDWKRISIGGHVWYVPCRNIRCQIPTINLETGEFEPSREPYKTLQSFRRIDEGMKYYPCFGMNLVPDEIGYEVRVGDTVKVIERGSHWYENIANVR